MEIDSGNTAWVLTSAALVLLMTPGLALFYGGMARSKSVLNMLMMNIWCLLIIPDVWVIVGYSIADRMTVAWIGGNGYPDGGWEYNLAVDVPAATCPMASPRDRRTGSARPSRGCPTRWRGRWGARSCRRTRSTSLPRCRCRVCMRSRPRPPTRASTMARRTRRPSRAPSPSAWRGSPAPRPSCRRRRRADPEPRRISDRQELLRHRSGQGAPRAPPFAAAPRLAACALPGVRSFWTTRALSFANAGNPATRSSRIWLVTAS